MDIPELITRNIEEILTEEELIELLRSKKKIRTYVGYETSGFVHIGTASTALKQLDFYNAGWEVVVLLADLHTFLNSKGSKEWIESMINYWREVFKALGLKKAEYVTGSEFEYEPKYVLDLLRSTLLTTQTRARRSMDVIRKEMEDPKVSQQFLLYRYKGSANGTASDLFLFLAYWPVTPLHKDDKQRTSLLLQAEFRLLQAFSPLSASVFYDPAAFWPSRQ